MTNAEGFFSTFLPDQLQNEVRKKMESKLQPQETSSEVFLCWRLWIIAKPDPAWIHIRKSHWTDSWEMDKGYFGARGKNSMESARIAMGIFNEFCELSWCGEWTTNRERNRRKKIVSFGIGKERIDKGVVRLWRHLVLRMGQESIGG